jgi:subtilisin family serine protease/Mg-chelatase subunit ChlD
MTKRYLITSRSATDREGTRLPAIAETVDVSVVARLDHGLLIDADEAEAERLAEAGWRVKELRNAHRIRLFTYEIDTETGDAPPTPPEFEGISRAEADEPEINHLVQLVGPVQESWLAVLADRGIRVVEPVGPYAYFVRADADTVKALEALPFVEWTGPLRPAYKVNPVLLGSTPEEEPTMELGPIEALDIGILADGDVDAIAALVTELGGTVQRVAPETSDIYRSITAQLPNEALPTIAAHDDVRWIDAVHAPIPEDERSAQIVYEDLDGAAAPNTAPVVGYAANLAALGVDGTSVTIAICDTGVDTNAAATMHADLAGRFAFAFNANGSAIAGADPDGHGTHVAGIAAGNGATGDTDPQGFVLGLGVATGAQVGCVVSNGTRQQRIETSAQNGADVMNNSYALDGSGYGAGDRTFDLGVRDADPNAAGLAPLVIVFSAGNSGPGAGTVTKNPKNAILAGNQLNFRPGEGDVDDIRGIRNSSSRGPADDGRTLPTIIAPGTDIVSARAGFRGQYVDTNGVAHANHTQMSGTSMASPHVAGLAAVIIDWWRQTRNGRTPSPALVKALLAATTESAQGGPGVAGGLGVEPNNNVGWGRVSLENALLQAPASDRGPKIFVDQRHAFTATGQEYTIRVAAADITRPLRVALTWTDAAGAVGANPALVNDLDLEVLSVNTGDLFRGNVFAGGFSATGGVADDLNNSEVVAIQNPAGVYEITVVASNLTASARPDIASPWQDFALVIDNAEVPAADPVSVVSVLDRSGSMQFFNYVDITRQTSRQFIDLMSVDDAVGVVSFGDTGVEEYPGTGTTQTIVGQATRDAAKVAVDGIGFGGCTFMGAGIQTGGAMLAGAGSRRALVLLSDGYDNKGCDAANPARPSASQAAAALPADLPIYSCAMGPASDQTLLAQLADSTDGRYYFMPTIDDLFEIYNYIRGQVTGDGVIVNESATASVSRVTGWVDGCAQSVLFTVAWQDPSLKYVSREPKGRNEIAVRLRSPGGRWLPRSATEFVRTVGEGYVSFSIQEPQFGLWTVEVATGRAQHTPYTVGGFVRSPVGLRVDVPTLITAGEPIDIRASVSDGRSLLTGVKLRARVSAPRASLNDYVRKFRDQLSRIKIPRARRRDGKPDRLQQQLIRLVLLRAELKQRTGEDILAPIVRNVALGATTLKPNALRTVEAAVVSRFERSARSLVAAGGTAAGSVGGVIGGVSAAPVGFGTVLDPRLVLRPQQTGVLSGRFGATRVPGSHTVQVTASGFSPACNSRFVRHDLVSVVVAEKG